ncbi:hypothetical protein HPB47_002225 [Ixodes persulcatus]|uniref:Uncharacterized protein n=1 Tax=Ixodes persulcatus TaxID=34615 RepID=A0AC60PN18_IXOPE|nr:hypothetical protein HPB47_002225 [Ixodes persulcatus]
MECCGLLKTTGGARNTNRKIRDRQRQEGRRDGGAIQSSADELHAVRRSQNTHIIYKTTALLETTDSATLTSLLERLTTSSSELRQINSEIKDGIPDGDLVAEYTTVVVYDNLATRIISLLGRKATSLRQREVQPPPPPVSSQSKTSDREGAQNNPAAAIAGLQATDACYNHAVNIHFARFGGRRRTEQDHLAELRTLPHVI